jgi:hypothetical protein
MIIVSVIPLVYIGLAHRLYLCYTDYLTPGNSFVSQADDNLDMFPNPVLCMLEFSNRLIFPGSTNCVPQKRNCQ